MPQHFRINVGGTYQQFSVPDEGGYISYDGNRYIGLSLSDVEDFLGAGSDTGLWSVLLTSSIVSSGYDYESGEVTVGDRVFDRTFSDLGVKSYQIDLVFSPGMSGLINLESMNPEIATLIGSTLKYVSDGICVLRSWTSEFEQQHEVVFSSPVPQMVDTFSRFISGSLGKDASDAVDSRIAGETVAAKAIYSTQDHATPTYVRAASCWAADLDLTCISPYNSASGSGLGVTLVTPQHAVGSAHAGSALAVGVSVRAVASDGTVHDRTVLDVKSYSGYQGQAGGYEGDIIVALFETAFPVSISYCKVLPDAATLASKLSQDGSNVPVLVLDKEEKALVADLSDFDRDGLLSQYGVTDNLFALKYPSDSQRAIFYENLIGGDSGNPVFMIISGDLVLCSTHTFGGAGYGASYAVYAGVVQQLINELDTENNIGGNFTLTYPDLNTFSNI